MASLTMKHALPSIIQGGGKRRADGIQLVVRGGCPLRRPMSSAGINLKGRGKLQASGPVGRRAPDS